MNAIVPTTRRTTPRTGVAALLSLGLMALAGCDRAAPTGPAPRVGALAAGASADVTTDPDYIAPLEVTDADGVYSLAGVVVARFRAGASAAHVAAAHGASVRRALLLSRTFVLDVPVGHEAAVAAALARNPNVEFAEPDRLMSVTPCEVGSCTTIDDPFFTYQWALHNNGVVANAAGTVFATTGKVDADIDWLEAYDFLGAAFAGSATIGIVDTGVRGTHEELAGRVVAARNFASGYPVDFTTDRISHGTSVAAIAAGRANNALGTSGVAYAPNIRVVNAKACELYLSNGKTVTACVVSSTADAIVWATDQGANVINLSLGGDPAATSGSAAHQAALQYARSRNVLPFCAAGNENAAAVGFPARFPECVAVAATTWSDTRAAYSNHAPQVALAAPGGEGSSYGGIVAAFMNTDVAYGFKSGTSMATPQAAGLAALLYATGMTRADDVLARLQGTADDLGPAGRDEQFGAGRINAYRALTQVDPNAPPVARPGGPYAGIEGNAVAFDGSASVDPNLKPLAWAWSFGDGSTATGARPTHAYVDDGSYTVTLTVTDASGLRATATTTATIANAAPTATLTLAATTILSGQTATATARFGDAGAGDAPWTYAFDWGIGSTTTGSTTDRAATLTASRTYLKAGTYAVRVDVTDKDGATGSATAPLTVQRVTVGIDVKPGSTENPIYWNQPDAAKIPVAILGSATLNVRDVVVSSVAMGDYRVAIRKSGAEMASFEDVNGDGIVDLVMQMDQPAMDAQGTLLPTTTTLELFADLASGVQIRGQDAVRVIQ